MKTFKRASHYCGTVVLIFSLSFIIPDSLYTQCGWIYQSSGTTTDLHSAYIINSNTGWAAGERNILMTINGGLNWTAMFNSYENDYYEFNSVYFINAETGWAAGDLFRAPPGTYHKVILKTTNAGLNWIQQYINTESGLKSIYFITSSTGWAVGANTILATVDGGLSWTAQNFPGGENFYYTFRTVYFANSEVGWAAGDLYVDPPGISFSVILKSVNKGMEWIEQYRAINPGISSVWFSNLLTGWAVGGGIILNTANGGENWVIQAVYGNENCSYCLNSVHFENETTGWAAGGSQCEPGHGYARIILKTINGGLNWEELSVASGESSCHLNSVFFTNELTGWAMGDGGTILKTTDGGLIGFEPAGNEMPKKFSLCQNYPNPFNPITKIKFDLPKSSYTKLSVYDLLGREIAVLVKEQLKSGTHEVEWDASNFSSGVYFCRLVSSTFVETKKMILVK